MDLGNSGRRAAIEAAEDSLLLVNPREIKLKLRGRGRNTQVCVHREREPLCKPRDAGGWAASCPS